MKFFFPDAQDLVDPSFDFELETRSETRIRQRDDLYAHEVFDSPPYDGILLSKGIVEGAGGAGGRFSMAQRQRLLREGAHAFLRLRGHPTRRPLEVMGDCGAFSYVNEPEPPYSVDEVLDFYETCDVDYGFSVDHVVLPYDKSWDDTLPGVDVVPEKWRQRREITLELADEFLRRHRVRRLRGTPIGVAQGWSPKSYADSVDRLQGMGYTYIALGGLVPLKTPELLQVVSGVQEVRKPDTKLHLLGVTRIAEIPTFAGYGVASFDSTSPLRQAFKDDRDNYYTSERTYPAVRVPQVQGNPKLQRQILAGRIGVEEAQRLERDCLELARAYDRNGTGIQSLLAALSEYEQLYSGDTKFSDTYRETLEDRPWSKCRCNICTELGINVILFRGAERNRRRGFHNLFVTYARLLERIPSKPTPRPPANKKRPARGQVAVA